MNKKGITLIILIITIVLIIVLLGITTASIGNGIQDARYTALGEDLVLIEDGVQSYYIQNGVYPILENKQYKYNISKPNELAADDGSKIPLNSTKSEYLEAFKQELIENSDLSNGENIVPDSYFYKIDLSKIGVQTTTRGNLKNGNNDIYVIAYPSQTVYYLKGVVANNTIYYSLANISDVKKAKLENHETKFTQNGLSVIKENKVWSNILGVQIYAKIVDPSEKIYVKTPVRNEEIELNISKAQYNDAKGEYSFTLKSLDGSLGLTENEVARFNLLQPSEKYIYIVKRKNGVESAKIKVDISNYDTQSPSFTLKADNRTVDFTITSEEGYNKITYQGKDNASGIGEVRYVYYKEFDENGLPQDLIPDTSIITDSYMIQNGKKANVSNSGKVEMKVPKDIEGIYITMFDKARNSVTLQKNIETDMYVGINPINISNNLKFNIVIKTSKSIASAVAYFSEDGTNYIDEQELTLTPAENNIYNSNVEFENTGKEFVHVKVVVADNSTPQKQEVRIKKIDLKQLAISLLSEEE